jgi:hypothetical protein
MACRSTRMNDICAKAALVRCILMQKVVKTSSHQHLTLFSNPLHTKQSSNTEKQNRFLQTMVRVNWKYLQLLLMQCKNKRRFSGVAVVFDGFPHFDNLFTLMDGVQMNSHEWHLCQSIGRFSVKPHVINIWRFSVIPCPRNRGPILTIIIHPCRRWSERNGRDSNCFWCNATFMAVEC